MNKLCIILSAALCSLIYGQDIGSQRWVENEARRLQNLNLSNITLESLSSEHREDIIKELIDRSEWRLLIRLRNEDTIRKYVERYTDKKGQDVIAKRILSESQSPWLLPLLAPLLDQDPTIQHRYYHSEFPDGEDFGYPHAVAEIMARIIRDSPEFPQNVRIEAEKLKGVDPQTADPWLLAGVRDWWKENGDFVLQERYDAVTPIRMKGRYEVNLLETYGLLAPTLEPIHRDERNPNMPKEQHSPSDLNSTDAVNSPPNPAKTNTTHDRPKIFSVLVATVGLSILAIFIFVLYQKSTDK